VISVDERTTTPIERAAAILGDRARRQVPVGSLTTYRVGGRAALFMRAESVEDLELAGRAVAASEVPAVVLGRGSNMLVADGGYEGLVVELGSFAGQIEVAGSTVVAGGAVLLPVLARRSAAAGLTGLEWMVGIPGSVGGAVRMNAGGHGSDMAAVLAGVHIVDLASGEDCEVAPTALALRFRGSGLADHQVVVAARFELAMGDRARSEAEITEIVRWRREHQPGGQNCGSVFVNPIPFELSAGEVIDDLGLRGFRIGTAAVSTKHANFIQADEGGSAADVHAVMDAVRAKVLVGRGIALHSEVRLVGFASEDGDG
jgi:UDP-N-acetylmuramate dehydrogenase